MGSPAEAQALLRRLGATLLTPRHFEQNALFDFPAGTLKQADSVLRLRRALGQAQLTYKGPGRLVEGVKTRVEIETAVADADALERILAGIGLSPRFRYEKYREVYVALDAEIVVDEIPIGTFLEIEGTPGAIHAVASRLGFTRSDYVLLSYPALFFAGGGVGDMLFGLKR